MKKFLVILMVVAMASFLLVGCLGEGVVSDTEEEEEEEEVVVVPATVAPIIVGVTDGAYVNKAEAVDGITVNGTAPTYSEVKIYINDICAGTGDALANGTWTVVVAKADLGADGAKVLYATAKEAALDVSAKSNEKTFTLDTVIPSIASSRGTAGTVGTAAAVAEVALSDTNLLFNNWAVNNAALLVGGTWKIEIIGIVDINLDGVVSAGDTITFEITDPLGVKSPFSFGYTAALANYTTFIPGVSVDFPVIVNVAPPPPSVYSALAFADIGAEVFVLVTPVVAAVPGFIDVTFDETVTGASVLAGVWTAFAATTNTLPAVTVRSSTVARLTETAAVIPNLVAGVAYSVSVNGIIDLAGNTILAAAPSQAIGIVIP